MVNISSLQMGIKKEEVIVYRGTKDAIGYIYLLGKTYNILKYLTLPLLPQQQYN